LPHKIKLVYATGRQKIHRSKQIPTRILKNFRRDANAAAGKDA